MSWINLESIIRRSDSMIYRSNLTAPDLSGNFRMISKPRHWSLGHDVPSDPDFEPECAFMSVDEAAVLEECAMRSRGQWVDIGSRTGWSSAYIALNGNEVIAVDSAYSKDSPVLARAELNIRETRAMLGVRWFMGSSAEFFEYCSREHAEGPFAGVCVDGNHDSPEPLRDAQNALRNLAPTGVIVFHDFWGRPIREGVEYLMDQGLKCRVYNTPAGMAVCWRGDFVPPNHTPDPAINWSQIRRERVPEFDFSRCS